MQIKIKIEIEIKKDIMICMMTKVMIILGILIMI